MSADRHVVAASRSDKSFIPVYELFRSILILVFLLINLLNDCSLSFGRIQSSRKGAFFVFYLFIIPGVVSVAVRLGEARPGSRRPREGQPAAARQGKPAEQSGFGPANAEHGQKPNCKHTS